MHFTKSRKVYPEPELYLKGTKVPVKSEVKFLGVIFDKKLTFVPHIKYLKDKCLKALNLLKVVSRTDWGGDRKTLLHLYRSLIRSKLDYGSLVYGSARKSVIQMLDPVAHLGLRLALGAYKTFPKESLYTEAGEPPLNLRREKLAIYNTLSNCPLIQKTPHINMYLTPNTKTSTKQRKTPYYPSAFVHDLF